MSAPMQPWAPTLTPHQTRRAGKTLEELSELSAVLARVQIQGLDEIDISSGKTNRQRLTEEIADVMAQIPLTIDAFELDRVRISARIVTKRGQMNEWEAHYHVE